MELGFRVFFRLGVVLLLLFVAFRNFRGFPHEAEAAVRVAIRGHGSRSYNSMYRGRYIYRPSFGRSSRNRGDMYADMSPADKQLYYYHTKMAEWREKQEKQRLLMANSTSINGTETKTTKLSDYDYEDPSEEEEEESEEYDYDKAPAITTATIPDSTTTTTAAEAETSTEIPLLLSNETSSSTTSKPMVQPIRRSYGLRYGRVKVETLKH